MIKRLVFGLFLLAVGNCLFAESEFMVISEVGSSAGSVRLANIQGFSYLSNSVFENPAALYRVYQGSAAIFQTSFMDEVNFMNMSCAIRTGPGVLGLGYMSSSIDNIYTTDIRANSDGDTDVPDSGRIYKTGTFSEKREIMKVAYSISQSRSLHVGLGGSYYSMSMDTVKGSGYNVDFGVIIDSDVFDFSFTAKNILSSMKVDYTDSVSLDQFLDASGNIREEVNDVFNGQLTNYSTNDLWQISSDGISETLPLQIIYGVRYTAGPFDLMGQLKSTGENRQFVKNVSVNYTPPFLSFFSISGGIRQSIVNRIDQGVADEVVITSKVMGIGLELMGVTFDYAYETNEDHPEFQNKHYFSLGLSF